MAPHRTVALMLESLEPRTTPSYTFTDLGTLGGSASSAASLNAFGQVTGNSDLAGNQLNHSFFYNDPGPMMDIGTLGGMFSFGSAINNVGHISGQAHIAGTSSHGFLWNGTDMRDIGTLA